MLKGRDSKMYAQTTPRRLSVLQTRSLPAPGSADKSNFTPNAAKVTLKGLSLSASQDNSQPNTEKNCRTRSSVLSSSPFTANHNEVIVIRCPNKMEQHGPQCFERNRQSKKSLDRRPRTEGHRLHSKSLSGQLLWAPHCNPGCMEL